MDARNEDSWKRQNRSVLNEIASVDALLNHGESSRVMVASVLDSCGPKLRRSTVAAEPLGTATKFVPLRFMDGETLTVLVEPERFSSLASQYLGPTSDATLANALT